MAPLPAPMTSVLLAVSWCLVLHVLVFTIQPKPPLGLRLSYLWYVSMTPPWDILFVPLVGLILWSAMYQDFFWATNQLPNHDMETY